MKLLSAPVFTAIRGLFPARFAPQDRLVEQEREPTKEPRVKPSLGITGNIETYRQGATFCRNGMDWAKEQRDESIRQVNERWDKHHPKTVAIESDLIQASSFTSETTTDEIYTTETPSKESRNSLAKDFDTIS